MNPDVFRWARETAGLSIEQAAAALAIKQPDRLRAIEAGAAEVSRPLLLRMAKLYRRPLVTFYLPAPPPPGDRGEDFRTLPADRAVADDALLDALIRDVRARHDVVRSLTAEDQDAEPLPFVGSMSMKDSPRAVLASIQRTLHLDVAIYRRKRNAEEAFVYLRDCAETAGIFVLLIGNLGSHHSAISVQSFRGFAIADRFAPFVIINDQDAKTAWSFTLLHELAHLWLGTTGVSGTSGEKAIERFCNEVASLFLLPNGEIRQLAVADDVPSEQAIDLITRFATPRHLSRKMVAYALFRAGQISHVAWTRLDQAIEDLWQRERAARKSQAKESESDGPSYYVVRRHRLGRALLDFVNRSLSEGSLTPVKAAKVLGVKPRSVYTLLAPTRLGGAEGRG
jgi:Zn-dependent peptidase ImmA (M78 family)